LAEIDCVLLLAGGLPLGSCSWDFWTVHVRAEFPTVATEDLDPARTSTR